jgi:putative transposase
MRAHAPWRWRLDEVYVKINGEMRYLWRAVDHEGEVLESYVAKTRDKAAALRFIKKAMKRPCGLRPAPLPSLRQVETSCRSADSAVQLLQIEPHTFVSHLV